MSQADENQIDEAALAAARGDEMPADDVAPDEKKPDATKTDEPAAETTDELSEADAAVETDEERAEREAEEAEAAKAKRTRIPLSRHEEILNKARAREEALVQRLQALEQRAAQTEAAPRKDVLGEMKATIDTLQDKYEDLVFEGKKEEARQVRSQLESMRERYTDTKTAISSDHARASTIDSLKYEAALAKAEADHPALNPDNEATFDHAKANEVAQLLNMFQNAGLTRQAALEKAVRYVMGAPAAKTGDAAADAVVAKRLLEARQRALETQKRQPADGTITGSDNDKAGKRDNKGLDIMKMSQDAFAKLDEATLAAARGDVVA